MAQLLQRIESLEGLSKGDFDSQLARLSAYGLRSEADFDKYTALSMAESVAREPTVCRMIRLHSWMLRFKACKHRLINFKHIF